MKPATTYPALVGAIVARIREECGRTQADLAARLRLAASTLSRIEGGASALTVDQLAAVAEALGVRPHAVLLRASDAADAARREGVEVLARRVLRAELEAEGLVLVDAHELLRRLEVR